MGHHGGVFPRLLLFSASTYFLFFCILFMGGAIDNIFISSSYRYISCSLDPQSSWGCVGITSTGWQPQSHLIHVVTIVTLFVVVYTQSTCFYSRCLVSLPSVQHVCSMTRFRWVAMMKTGPNDVAGDISYSVMFPYISFWNIIFYTIPLMKLKAK